MHFEYPFNLTGKSVNNVSFNRPIMALTQILLHRWGAQNKGFGSVSQTDLNSLVSTDAQAKTNHNNE